MGLCSIFLNSQESLWLESRVPPSTRQDVLYSPESPLFQEQALGAGWELQDQFPRAPQQAQVSCGMQSRFTSARLQNMGFFQLERRLLGKFTIRLKKSFSNRNAFFLNQILSFCLLYKYFALNRKFFKFSDRKVTHSLT